MSYFISEAHADNALPNSGPVSGAPTAATTSSTTAVPTQAGAPAQPGPLGMLMPFILMFGVIYFLIIRPQQKKMKEHQAELEKLKVGDEVITTAGIFGKITGITDKVITVEISDGVRVKMLKGQVASVNPDVKNLKSIDLGAAANR